MSIFSCGLLWIVSVVWGREEREMVVFDYRMCMLWVYGLLFGDQKQDERNSILLISIFSLFSFICQCIWSFSEKKKNPLANGRSEGTLPHRNLTQETQSTTPLLPPLSISSDSYLRHHDISAPRHLCNHVVCPSPYYPVAPTLPFSSLAPVCLPYHAPKHDGSDACWDPRNSRIQ